MTNKHITDKLKHLEKYNLSEKTKINIIENVYKIVNVCFDQYIKNWQSKTNK